MRYIIFLLLSVVLLSCSSENYFSESQATSEDYTWDKSDMKSFNFDIDQTDNYDIQLNVKYLTGFRWDTLRLQWNTKRNIDFQHAFLNVNIAMIDPNGNHIGEAQFDNWHTDIYLTNNIHLKKGNYTINVKHNMAEDILPYVTDIGITIEKL